ncbi:MAG: hypothetical protein J5608_02555 [Alphaproteobacteria bacterium]|nr:hypothetical protein [Alphaproteobacteria bacterium]
MIQNVQSYSSNPFYNSDNATVSAPKIIYATGPALKPADCQRAVQNLVEVECATRNRCQDLSLGDVRPNLMVKLSTLPGYNYASSCAGYIDTIFEQYKKNNQAQPSINPYAAFPTVAAPNAGQNVNSRTPQWKTEYNERVNELRTLQQATKTTQDTVSSADFPKTFEDLSFAERNEIKWEGYEPYKDAQVYKPLNIIREEPNSSNSTSNSGSTVNSTVYKCIKDLGDQEDTATDQLYRTSPSSPEFNQVKSTLATAVTRAIYSACSCTQNSDDRDSLRRVMGVTCDNAFLDQAKQEAIRYVASLVASLR